MFYILNERYRLRGWQKVPYAVYDTARKAPVFLSKEKFNIVAKCNGFHSINRDELPENLQKFLDAIIKDEVVREAAFGDMLLPEQEYKLYPSRYKREAHWSITGECNLKCRHCFMSAPGGKHGSPTHEQLIETMDQFVECGIFQVGITGGEPLIRPDFLEIVKELLKREIGINCIYTNGWLVNEELLDAIEALGIKPPFQLSYDGVGQHDFLRGIDGCEERTLNALRLLQERGYSVSVSTCLHKGNIHTIRETVKLMASLGVRSMKIGATLVLGEWACDELREISLTPTEELEAFEKYIPEFFEDGAPLSIMLSGTFSYNKFEESWSFNCYRPCPTKWEGKVLSCPSIKNAFYVGADGMVAPCMGMCDCGYATNFPNLYKEPLRDILGDTHFMDLCATTVKQVRDGNDKCRKCDYVDKCTGGCRNSAIIDSDNFYDVDKSVCFFFENGWEDRLRAVSEEHYVKYCEKNGLTPKKYERPLDEEEIMC